MRFPRNARLFRGQMEVAPFAGVFFLLLIFLLLNSSMVFTPGVPIHLPDGANLPGIATRTVVVAVDEGGQIYFENQVSDVTRLKPRLQEAVAKTPEPLTLIVQADQKVRYETLIPLLLLAKSVGIHEALLAVRPPVVPTLGPATP